MEATTQGSANAVSIHTGATVNGVQTEAEVLMRRHTPDTWPEAHHALNRWEALCRSLKAEDKEVPIKDIIMNPASGGLYRVNAERKATPTGFIPTRTALGHLTSFMGEDKPATGVVDNLEWYPPAIRAQMLAAIVDKASARTVVMRLAADPMSDTLVVRAVTSERHSQAHGDDLAIIEQLRRLNLTSAKMRVVKQWDNTHVEVLFPNKAKQVRPGVVINTRINIRNSETKGGSWEASVGTLNLVCINGMVGNGNQSTVSIKHMGDIRSRMRAGLVTTIDLAEVYLEEYMEAYQQALPKTRADAITSTLRRFKLPANVGAGLATLWDVDGERGGGDTVAGLANAITRYAQGVSVERGLELEKVAGEVVSLGVDWL